MNYSNNAYSVLNGAITNVATAITLATGTGARFPASDFRVTLIGYDGLGNENAWEICHCTSRSGDVLTVTRGQESTTAVAWANATRIENRVTAGTMNLLAPLASPSFTGVARFGSDLANYVQSDGAAASGTPALSAQGSDTNINLALRGKGNGGVTLGSQSVIGFVATAPVSGVNYAAAIGAATGTGVQLVAGGGDANISMNIAGKGSGSVLAWSNGSTIFSGSAPASSVNFLGFSGQVTGQAPSISAIGSDANITLKLIPKGTGSVQIAGAATFPSQYNAGNSGTAVTVNFANGQKQLLTLTGNATVTLSFPGVGNYQLLLTQDATGGRTVTWSGVSLYVGSATAPAINTAANSSTVVSLYFDGANVWLGASKVNA